MSYVYGKNAVHEKLKQKSEIDEILIQKGSKNNDVERMAKEKRIRIRYVEKRELDRICEGGNHQGVAVKAEDYKTYSLADLINQTPKGKYPLLVMLDGLEDPHNLGAILRTCDAVGADGVIIGKHRSVGLTSTVAKVSTGAIEHVKVAQVTNLRQALDELKEQGYWVVGTDAHEAIDYRDFVCDMPLVVVIGSEGKGISRIVLDACDYKVALPMVGHVNSLNASVATAVLLYQVYNKRNPR
ncbi:MAG: 23S rRNA (guanosine(2251)-2'-O)-methyltransferase RlmB [Erysipelotrichales bacterium]|nr:23S rRNA (guanosine(2251)-2'-O)-methyltransferase RlmB [Erysipelotrichales bacterium]